MSAAPLASAPKTKRGRKKRSDCTDRGALGADTILSYQTRFILAKKAGGGARVTLA